VKWEEFPFPKVWVSKSCDFQPLTEFPLSRPGGSGQLGVSGMGTATASAPSPGPAPRSRHCGSARVLLPQSLTLPSFSSLQGIFVSTKGKLLSIRWEDARPGRGQRDALASASPRCRRCPAGPQPPSHRVSPPPADPPHPSVCAAGRDLALTSRVAHVRGHTPCPRRRAVSRRPAGAAAAGCRLGTSRARGKQDRPSCAVQVPPCFICRYQ